MDSVALGEELVKTILSAIVDRPDELRVKGWIDERGVYIEVEPAREDLGRVIGQQGATINAVRYIMRAFGVRHSAYYSVKVVEGE